MALTVAPDFTDGVLTASRLQQLADSINERTPLTALKTSDQNVGPSNTVLQDVTEMVLAVQANVTYELVVAVQYSSNSTADLKMGWTVPSGTTMDYVIVGFNTSEATSLNRATQASSLTQGGSANSVLLYGTVTTSSTAGSVQLQAAQNTSTAVATNIEAGSYMRLLRIT